MNSKRLTFMLPNVPAVPDHALYGLCINLDIYFIISRDCVWKFKAPKQFLIKFYKFVESTHNIKDLLSKSVDSFDLLMIEDKSNFEKDI